MTKFAFCLLLIAANCALSFAQTAPCVVSQVTPPALRGLELGLMRESVNQRLKWGLQESKPDESGFSDVTIGALQLPPQHQDGLRNLRLAFLDGKVITIEARYDDSTKWPSVEQFASAIATRLAVPDAWEKLVEPHTLKPLGLYLYCGNVGIAISTADKSLEPLQSPVVVLYDRAANTLASQRRAQSEAMKRRAFKP